MYFETTTKTTREGKKVNEQHIMKAVCFTDAEATTTMNFGENETFEITAIKKSKIKEIVNSESDFFYKVIASFFVTDDIKGTDKEVKEQYLFGAPSMDLAKKTIDEWVMGSAVPTEIKSIVETKIIQVL